MYDSFVLSKNVKSSKSLILIIKDFSTMKDFVIYDRGKSEYLNLSKASTWYDTTKIGDISASCTTSYTGNSISIDVKTGVGNNIKKVFTATIPLLKSFPDLVGYNKLYISFDTSSYMNYITRDDWSVQSKLNIGINGENILFKEIIGEDEYYMMANESADVINECRGNSSSSFTISLEHGVESGYSRSDSIHQKLIIKKIWLSIV